MSEASLRGVRWQLFGRVQGVGFRAWTARRARRLGVVGEVKNLPDGSVEIQAAADPQALAAFRAEVERGPAYSRVDRVEESPITGEIAGRWTGFDVTYF